MTIHAACEAKADSRPCLVQPESRLFTPPVSLPGRRNGKARFFLDFVRAGSNFMNPYRFRFRGFRAKVRVHAEIRNFIVKTVDSADELDRILRLRYEVFYKEFLEKRRLVAIDIDQFDLICDHLMVIEKETNACVGTYRLNCSLFNRRFYSETEFSMATIVGLSGVKLELGRACVHKDYRKGILLALLWRGLGEYIKATGAKYLFGCSSVKTMDPLEIAAVHSYLMAHHASPVEHRATPRASYAVKALPLYATMVCTLKPEIVRQHVGHLIPALLLSYLKAGAVICGDPALDKQFKCVDFLTLLDLERSADASIRRFF
jgi:putative hemolysin